MRGDARVRPAALGHAFGAGTCIRRWDMHQGCVLPVTKDRGSFSTGKSEFRNDSFMNHAWNIQSVDLMLNSLMILYFPVGVLTQIYFPDRTERSCNEVECVTLKVPAEVGGRPVIRVLCDLLYVPTLTTIVKRRERSSAR